MKERLLQVLLHPVVISLIITIGIIALSPDYFSKFELKPLESEVISKFTTAYFQDLNKDQHSEKIIAQVNTLGYASYLIFDGSGEFIDQFNLNHPFALNHGHFWFQDMNDNGFKEIYTPTLKNDSLFLNIHEPFSADPILVRDIFIDTIVPHNGKLQFDISRGYNFSNNYNSWKEIVFSVCSGFSGYPRNIYKYDPVQKSVRKSPHLVNSANIIDVVDIDQDGKNEILVGTNANGNYLPPTISTKTDESTWTTILDNDLNFLFPPIQFPTIGSSRMVAIKEKDSIQLVGMFLTRKPSEIPSQIFHLSTKGELLKSKPLAMEDLRLMILRDEMDVLTTSRARGKAFLFDPQLNRKSEVLELPKSYGSMRYADINGDKKKEWLFMEITTDALTILDANFSHPVQLPIDKNGIQPLHYGIRQLGPDKIHLYIQLENVVYHYSYQENPLYYLQYLLYLGIFLALFLLVKLIEKGQSLKLAKQRAIEEEISELQIKSIKNQVDPHFVFNAINTISEMTLMDNKLEADRYISRFSNFMRDTLNTSDKITTTLQEELEYTESFIQLQQIRYANPFSYSIKVDSSVNQKSQVPKHSVFCYVENAIKHGVGIKKEGEIRISVKKEFGALVLAIEDNAGGLNGSSCPKTHSTGKGMNIMDRVFNLFTKLKRQRIEKSVVETKDDAGKVIGLRVEIRLYDQKAKSYVAKED